MFDVAEKKPAWPETEDRFVEEAADPVALVDPPDRSSSRSLSLLKSLLSSFWRSFSYSTDSTTVTARLRLTKFDVPEKLKRTMHSAD